MTDSRNESPLTLFARVTELDVYLKSTDLQNKSLTKRLDAVYHNEQLYNGLEADQKRAVRELLVRLAEQGIFANPFNFNAEENINPDQAAKLIQSVNTPRLQNLSVLGHLRHFMTTLHRFAFGPFYGGRKPSAVKGFFSGLLGLAIIVLPVIILFGWPLAVLTALGTLALGVAGYALQLRIDRAAEMKNIKIITELQAPSMLEPASTSRSQHRRPQPPGAGDDSFRNPLTPEQTTAKSEERWLRSDPNSL